MTGATGFLGGANAVEAIKRGVGSRLLFLVRASTPEQGLQRITNNLRLLGAAEEDIAKVAPEQILCGDLADIESIALDSRLDHVSVVIHSAALATFSHHPSLEIVNVDGTVALGKLMNGRPALKRFMYIGTAMACGENAAVDGCVPEIRNLPLDIENHLVPYTRSKALAEKRLRKLFPDLPLVVVRPSIIVGHTTLGCGPSQSIFWVFLAWQILSILTTKLDEKIDVIPVDWCAAGIIALALKDTLAHDVFHLSAGKESSKTFREIDVAIAQARGVQPIGEDYELMTVEQMGRLLPRIRERIPDCNPRLLLRAMKLYGGFAQLNYVFSNDNLKAEGILPAPPMTDYIGLCVKSASHISIGEQMKWDFK